MAANLVMADLQLVDKCQSPKINEKRLHIKFPKYFAPESVQQPAEKAFYNREIARYVLQSKIKMQFDWIPRAIRIGARIE